ncbi:MAG: helix-turn-helix transcriptional regulator [Saccharofermentans sp.]|nr:helix-turn-helix transcriptional regulator [Saccharofermentans sp.]
MYPRIKELRESRGLKQREIAELISCSQQVYSKYELGVCDIPTDILIKLSNYYDVSVDYILGITNNPAPY